MLPAAMVSAATPPFWLAVATSRTMLALLALSSPSGPTLRRRIANRLTPARLSTVDVTSGGGGS